MKEFIRLTEATDGRDILLATERIVLCERKEDKCTRITYRISRHIQGFGDSVQDCRILFVRETVWEINSLIYGL